MRKANGSLTKEESSRLESLVEKGLDVLGLDSEEDAEPVTQKIQGTHIADGSSSERPLEEEDGNRETLGVSEGHLFSLTENLPGVHTWTRYYGFFL